MAVTLLSIDLLVRLCERGLIPSPRAVAEIGAQQVANDVLRSRDRVEFVGRMLGASGKLDLPLAAAATYVEGGAEHLPESAPLARGLWEWLGFDYVSVDIDGTPGSLALDLNFDAVPNSARHRFNLVTNFGSTEHVANQLNAFKVIHDLTAPDGVMIHTLPAQGFFNHGLVNYNPKWFWMLARSNEYRWLYFDYAARDSDIELPANLTESIVPYEPNIVDRAKKLRFVDGGLNVILQKSRDTEFVPPLDVPTGTKTANKALADRYWTVLTLK
jgi:SAM-dependent methyltransferase